MTKADSWSLNPLQPVTCLAAEGRDQICIGVTVRGPVSVFQLLRHCCILTHSSIYSSHSDKLEEKGHIGCREHRRRGSD